MSELPAMIPADLDIQVYKGVLFEYLFAFQYDLRDDYDIVAKVKKRLDDQEVWFSLDSEYYDSADDKKFRIYMNPDDTAEISTLDTKKGHWSIELRHKTDDTERHQLVRGRVTVFERTSTDNIV